MRLQMIDDRDRVIQVHRYTRSDTVVYMNVCVYRFSDSDSYYNKINLEICSKNIYQIYAYSKNHPRYIRPCNTHLYRPP